MAKHFTKEQIDEIRRQLATDAVRDTDLPVTDSFHGEDYVAIVQDGRNKRLSCDTFRNELQNGPQGESTYEIAVRHGYTGTEEEWLAIPQSGQITLINHGTITNAPDEEDITSQDELLKLADRPSAYGLGYCILRRNKTFAEQLTKTNTIYEIRYDFDLDGESVTVPEGCVLKFAGGKLHTGSVIFSETKIEGVPRLDVLCSGSISNIVAEQGWFVNNNIDKWHYFISNVDGPSVYNYVRGEYSASEKINKGVDKSITIRGNGAKINVTEAIASNNDSSFVIDIHPKTLDSYSTVSIIKAINKPIAVQSTVINNASTEITVPDGSYFRDGECIKYINKETGDYEIVSGITVSGNVITAPSAIKSSLVAADKNFVYKIACQGVAVANANAFHVGDVVALRDNKPSSFYWSRNYQEGEYVRINKIEGNTLFTANVIEGTYQNEGYLTACKVDIIDFEITNLHINQVDYSNTPLRTRGLVVQQGSGRYENVKVTGFTSGLVSEYCWNISVRNCAACNADVELSFDGYALYFVCCQGVSVIGGTYVGRNHGIAFGGPYTGNYNVINRSILIEKCETANISSHQTAASINSHDNTDLLTITNCKATGLYIGGKRIIITNNIIDRHIQFTPANCWNHTIANNFVGSLIYIYDTDNDSSYEHTFGNTCKVIESQNFLINDNVCGGLRILTDRRGNVDIDMTKVSYSIRNNKINGLLYVLVGYQKYSSTYYTSYDSIHIGGTVLMENNESIAASVNTEIYAKNITLRNNVIHNLTDSNDILLACETLVVDRTDFVNNLSSTRLSTWRSINADIRNSFLTHFVLQALSGVPETTRGKINILNNRVISSGTLWLTLKIALYDALISDNRIEATNAKYVNQANPARDESSTSVLGRNTNINGDLCNWYNMDSYNAIGLERFLEGKPSWWNGTAWVDATGEPIA